MSKDQSMEEIAKFWTDQKNDQLQKRRKDWTVPMKMEEKNLTETIKDPEARVNLVEIFTMLEDKNRRGELSNLPSITITFGGGESLGWTIGVGDKKS